MFWLSVISSQFSEKSTGPKTGRYKTATQLRSFSQDASVEILRADESALRMTIQDGINPPIQIAAFG